MSTTVSNKAKRTSPVKEKEKKVEEKKIVKKKPATEEGDKNVDKGESDKFPLFQGVVAYFDIGQKDKGKETKITKEFEENGGQVTRTLAKGTTHVIVCEGKKVPSSPQEDKVYVTSLWVTSCLQKGCLLDVKNFQNWATSDGKNKTTNGNEEASTAVSRKKKRIEEEPDDEVEKEEEEDSENSSLLASSDMKSGSFKQNKTKDKGGDKEPMKKKPKTTVSNSNSKVVVGDGDVNMGNKKNKKQAEVPISSKVSVFSKPSSSSIVSDSQKKEIIEESVDKDVAMMDLHKKQRKLRPPIDVSPQKNAQTSSSSKSMKPPIGASVEKRKINSASTISAMKDSSSSATVISVDKSKKKETPKKKKETPKKKKETPKKKKETPKKKKDDDDEMEFEESSQDSEGNDNLSVDDESIVGNVTENMEESVINANKTSDRVSQEWQKKHDNAKYILEMSCISNENQRATILSQIMQLPPTFSLSVMPPLTTDQESLTYHGEFFTHLIVENIHYKRTLKTLFAIAYGAKIVSSGWLFAMLEKGGEWVDETPYLLQDGSKFQDAIRRSQMAHNGGITGIDAHTGNNGLLFSELKFCLVGFNVADSVDEKVLGRLIEACGGTLVTETRDSDYTVVGSSAPKNCVDDDVHKTVSVKWVFETVGGYQLLPELDNDFRVTKGDCEEQQKQKSGKKKIEGTKKQQQQQKHKDGQSSSSASDNNNNNNSEGELTKKKGKDHKNPEQRPLSIASLSAHSGDGFVGEITKLSQDKNANCVDQKNNMQQKKSGEINGSDAVNKKSKSSSTRNDGKSNVGKGSVVLDSSSPKKSSSTNIKAKNKETDADVVLVDIDGNERFEEKVGNNEEKDNEGQQLDSSGGLEEGPISAAAVDQLLLSDDDNDNDVHRIRKQQLVGKSSLI